MKIIQKFALTTEAITTSYETYETKDQRFLMRPTLFTGVNHLYLRVNACNDNNTYKGSFQVYDFTHSQVLAEQEIDGGYPGTEYVFDLKDDIIEDSMIGYKIKGGNEAEEYYSKIRWSRFEIEQEDGTTGRKTALFYRSGGDAFVNPSQGWTADYSRRFIAHIDDFNGTVKAYIEAYMYAEGAGISQARLYDETADAAVSGSTVETTSQTIVRVQSGELTLIEGHIYRIEYKAATEGIFNGAWGAYIFITTEGFTKCVCIPWHQPRASASLGAGVWHDVNAKNAISLSKITYDTLQLKTNILHTGYTGVTVDTGQKLRNYTDNQDISGTEHTYQVYHGFDKIYSDNISTPDADDELIIAIYDNGDNYVEECVIFASMEKGFVVSISIPADPSQPSGYHCFMSQFVKNLLAGYIPLKTPDGVNRCW